MVENQNLIESIKDTLVLVDTVKSDLPESPKFDSDEMQQVLSKLKKLTARLESHLAVKH